MQNKFDDMANAIQPENVRRIEWKRKPEELRTLRGAKQKLGERKEKALNIFDGDSSALEDVISNIARGDTSALERYHEEELHILTDYLQLTANAYDQEGRNRDYSAAEQDKAIRYRNALQNIQEKLQADSRKF